MNIKLIVVGKTTGGYLETGIADYCSRLQHYVNFTYVELPSPKLGKKPDEKAVKQKEADVLLQQLMPSDYVVLLDEKGRAYRSIDFAREIQQKMNSSLKNLVFIVGGPFGFDERIYQRANEKLSLSKMTMSHQMIRLFFTEQLYRALSILRGEKYHHE
jgi:23S rRNA (pseudouridine1915-N3)-methyltransferase